MTLHAPYSGRASGIAKRPKSKSAPEHGTTDRPHGLSIRAYSDLGRYHTEGEYWS